MQCARNQDLLPLSKDWKEIRKAVREDMAHEIILETASKQVFRSQGKLDEIAFQFDVYFMQPKPIVPQTRKQTLDTSFENLLLTHSDLKNSYVYYLASS